MLLRNSFLLILFISMTLSLTATGDTTKVSMSDFDFILDECNCLSKRKKADGSWSEPMKTLWSAKKIAGGNVVQDYSRSADGSASHSAYSWRYIDTLTNEWVVSYISNKTKSGNPGVWKGRKDKDGNMVLKMDQKSPQGLDGINVLTFYDISEAGYKWRGNWTSVDGNIEYVFWEIECQRSVLPENNVCNNQIFRELDFWIGTWRVTTPNGQLAGYNTIDALLNECVIRESWTSVGVYRGNSYNFYNHSTRKWHQSWVDNVGNPLMLEGTVENNIADYKGTGKDQNGNKIYHHLTISKIGDNEVRQLWKTSPDQEKWTVVFDGKYVRVD